MNKLVDWITMRSMSRDELQRGVKADLAGTDSNMAGRLYRALVGAGLSTPAMRMQTCIGGGAQCADYLQAVADLVGSMLPSIVLYGVASAAEVDYASLAERMQREAITGECVIVGRSEIGAWGRLLEGPDHK